MAPVIHVDAQVALPVPVCRRFAVDESACDEDRNRILNGRAPVSDCGGLVQRGGRRPAGSRWSCQRAKASMDGRL